MSHEHPVYDNDGYFVLDPKTKSLDNQSGKTSVIQYDHNSEEIRFKFPKTIEGHDMSKVDLIQVHYDNTSTGTSASLRTTNTAPLNIRDTLEECKDDPECMTCSWLIGEESTQLAGTLKFKLKFVCFGNDGTIAYKMSTLQYTAYQVLESPDSTEGVIEIYPDIITEIDQLKRDVEELKHNGGVADLSGYVQETRKIAGVDLSDDITADELQDSLSVYPIVELSRSPKSAPEEELELKAKAGQLGIVQSGKRADFYRCISVTKHPQYGNTFIYDWKFLGSNTNCQYVPFSLSNLIYSSGAPFGGNMVYSDSSSGKVLYIRPSEGYSLVRIPLASDIVTAVDENSTDEQIPSAKLFYDTIGSIDTALDELHTYAQGIISGGVTE